MWEIAQRVGVSTGRAELSPPRGHPLPRYEARIRSHETRRGIGAAEGTGCWIGGEAGTENTALPVLIRRLVP